MVEVGDRVLVESEKVGAVTRSGVVTAVEDRLITVRWDSGSESVFVPSAGLRLGIGLRPKRRVPAGHWSRAASGGCRQPLKSLDRALTLHQCWAAWVAPSSPWTGGPPPC
jgi:hypothetical protein